jgi:3-oxoadipate enol-lactonase
MNRVKVNDVEIAYDDVGHGMPVVLLHGFPFNRSMWSEQVEALKDQYRVITPDLRGLGDTGLQGQEAGIEDMARDVAGLLDHLGLNRVVIGGLSMGGYVALAFHRLYPLRVRALILADTKAQADTDEAKKIRYQQAEAVTKDGMEPIADRMAPRLLTPHMLEDRKEIVERVRQMMIATPRDGAAAALRAMAARTDHVIRLPQILAPTLIIVGDEDEITSTEDSELMHREIRGSKLVTIYGAAHVSNIERPDEFNQALLDFLATLQP